MTKIKSKFFFDDLANIGGNTGKFEQKSLGSIKLITYIFSLLFCYIFWQFYRLKTVPVVLYRLYFD